MKKMKIFLTLFIILMLSGCTVEHNIVFKADHTIDEKITINESKEYIESTGYSVSDVVDSKLYSYEDEIEEGNYSKKVDTSSDNVKVKFESSNKSVEDFVDFLFFRKMFTGAIIDDTDEYYSFETSGYYNQSGLFYDDNEGNSDGGFVDKIVINIQFENKVLENNADKINKKTNTYTWIIDKNTKEKGIQFKLSKDIVKEVDKKENIVSNSNDNSLKRIFLIIIVLIGIIVGLFYYNYRNNN